MADTLTGKTEIDAVSQEMISQIVQELLIQEAKLLPTISDYSSQAVAGSDKVKIPRAGGFTVGDKTENTAVDAQSITYATDDLNLDKHKVVQVLMEDFANLQSKINAQQDIAVRAAKALALQIDTDILAALVATSASSPDHQIATAASQTFAEVDILECRKLLNDQSVPMSDRYFVIPTSFEKQALQIANFVQAERYGDRMPLVSGELGMAYGFRFIVHTGATNGVAYHKSHVAAAIQQALRYQTESALAHLAVRHSFDQVYGVKTLDSGKRGVLLSLAA